MNKVSVIIPNYNGKHFLMPCLEALGRQTMKDFDIIIIDNGSKDGSAQYIKDEHPGIHLIEFKENTGFCRAINEGVKAASSKYVLLLNNDTIPEEGFVEELYRGIESHKKAFSCASCMLTVEDHNILDSAGDLYNAFGWAFARGHGKPAELFDKPVKVFSACAGAAIYDRELFIKLGMLDEEHFAYMEDIDLGYRARINGYENWYIPTARVIHVGSGTSGSAHNEFKVTHSSRNNVYVIYKNMPLFQRIINAPFLFAGFTIKKMYFAKKGFKKTYENGLKEGKKLACSSKGLEKRQKFKIRNLKNYLGIQLELWANMFKRRA